MDEGLFEKRIRFVGEERLGELLALAIEAERGDSNRRVGERIVAVFGGVTGHANLDTIHELATDLELDTVLVVRRIEHIRPGYLDKLRSCLANAREGGVGYGEGRLAVLLVQR